MQKGIKLDIHRLLNKDDDDDYFSREEYNSSQSYHFFKRMIFLVNIGSVQFIDHIGSKKLIIQ